MISFYKYFDMQTIIIFLSGQLVIHAGLIWKIFLALKILHLPLANSNKIWLTWPDLSWAELIWGCLQVQPVITNGIYNIIQQSPFFCPNTILATVELLSTLPNYVDNFSLIVKIPIDCNILCLIMLILNPLVVVASALRILLSEWHCTKYPGNSGWEISYWVLIPIQWQGMTSEPNTV